MENFRITIGERIKLLRQNLNKTQCDICNAVHIEQVTLSQYETGKRTPKLEILIALAKYYNVTLDYLVGLSDILNADTTSSSSQNTNINTFSLKTQELVPVFEALSSDYKDIILGKAKDLLREQRLEKKELLSEHVSKDAG